jgi:hypothetical protein
MPSDDVGRVSRSAMDALVRWGKPALKALLATAIAAIGAAVWAAVSSIRVEASILTLALCGAALLLALLTAYMAGRGYGVLRWIRIAMARLAEREQVLSEYVPGVICQVERERETKWPLSVSGGFLCGEPGCRALFSSQITVGEGHWKCAKGHEIEMPHHSAMTSTALQALQQRHEDMRIVRT